MIIIIIIIIIIPSVTCKFDKNWSQKKYDS